MTQFGLSLLNYFSVKKTISPLCCHAHTKFLFKLSNAVMFFLLQHWGSNIKLKSGSENPLQAGHFLCFNSVTYRQGLGHWSKQFR